MLMNLIIKKSHFKDYKEIELIKNNNCKRRLTLSGVL